MKQRLTKAVASTAIITGVCLLAPLEALADPAISSVSGTFAHGASVTITGSGFGTKNPAKPKIWAHFESGMMQSDPNLSTATLGTNNISLTQVDTAHGNSAWAVRGIPNDGGVKRTPGVLWNAGADSTQTIFISVKRKWAHANFFATNRNLKFMRFWPQCSQGYPNHFAVVFTNKNIKDQVESPTTNNFWDEPFAENVWVHEEYAWRHSDVDVANGVTRNWHDGVPRAHITNRTTRVSHDWNSDGNINDRLWGCFRIEAFWTEGGASGGPPTSGAFMYLDDVYMDDTWARVMLGNASTFSASTHREPQIPTAWSSNSITISANQGAFPNFNNLYLYVVDSNGRVNSTGFPLSVEPPPNPPQNLRIQ